MPRIPTSTCRLQVRPGSSLVAIAGIVPYLRELGVGDVYLSPIQRARTGSEHGYDGVDPTRLDPELGAEADLEGLSIALRRHGMGLLLDIVPNHVAATFDNPWWRDLLAHGPASRRASFFDVDWHAEPALAERVLLPFLGRPYGEALEAGELVLGVREGRIVVTYYEHVFPLDPATWGAVLGDGEALRGALGAEHPAVVALDDLLAGVAALPSRLQRGRAALAKRSRTARRLRERLARAMGIPALHEHVDASIARLNGVPGDARSFDALDALLLAQPWRPVFWRSGYERLNYRRFFQINDLVGLRVEDERVFDAVHALPLRWLARGYVAGLRIDHVDGLYDPTGYLRRLQERIRAIHGGEGYVVVEKILVGEERLADEWPVAGTTGYELAVALDRVLVDPEGLAALQALYARLEPASASWPDLVHRQKRRMLSRFFAPEVVALERHLRPLAALDRHARDLSPQALRRALVEVTAGLGVYRTYLRDFTVAERDRVAIGAAVAEASRRGRADPRAVAFLGRVLALDLPPGLNEGERSSWLRFVARWQQLTGPAMAKGVEDTAFYIHTPLVSLNEVGGEPTVPADPVARFHAWAEERAWRWPGSLNAVSTHDTKRSADVRARIAVLSELPRAWAEALERWSAAVSSRTGLCPPAYERSLLFQTLLGVWPLEEDAACGERVEAYLVKAAREAKLETSWLDPDPRAEGALVAFARAFLADPPEDFAAFRRKVAFHGAINALAQTLVHLTAPGVPDLYQGDEIWSFALVDPDNRRPVDWAARRRLLASLDGVSPEALLASWRDGRIKLHVVRTVLCLRRERPELWRGDYHPVRVEGVHAASVLAFARTGPGGEAVVVVPRLSTRVTDGEAFPIGACWGDTRIVLPEGAGGRWTERLTVEEHESDGAIALSELLGRLPIALLTR